MSGTTRNAEEAKSGTQMPVSSSYVVQTRAFEMRCGEFTQVPFEGSIRTIQVDPHHGEFTVYEESKKTSSLEFVPVARSQGGVVKMQCRPTDFNAYFLHMLDKAGAPLSDLGRWCKPGSLWVRAPMEGNPRCICTVLVTMDNVWRNCGLNKGYAW